MMFIYADVMQGSFSLRVKQCSQQALAVDASILSDGTDEDTCLSYL